MNKFFTLILDLIFPKFCLNCHQEGLWLCRHCYEKIKIKQNQCCPICRKINNGSVCNLCINKTTLNGLITSTNYENKLIQKMIHLFKYQCIKDLSLPLSGLLGKTLFSKNGILNKKQINKGNTIIIAVPLHRKRFLERGYNQSALLAKNLAKKSNLTYYSQLVHRNKNTSSQAKLSKKDRINNLKVAFSLSKKFDFSGKNVIIIDDVATTLATLNSCAKLLKKAGANQIWGLVIARGNYK